MPRKMVPCDHSYTYILNQMEINSEVINAWYFEADVFSDGECDDIIRIGKTDELRAGGIMADVSEDELKAYRDVSTSGILPTPDNKWIFDRIGQVVMNANNEVYNYDIIGMREGLQFLHYDTAGHYKWHKDTGADHTSSRKLTVIVQLTDPDSYDGCDLELEGGIMLSRARGSITVFPSFYSHIVHPHKGGASRNSLAVWVYGPPMR